MNVLQSIKDMALQRAAEIEVDGMMTVGTIVTEHSSRLQTLLKESVFGSYFKPIDHIDTQPISVDWCITDSVYDLMVAVGIIKQRGTLWTTRTHYDPIVKEWVLDRTGLPPITGSVSDDVIHSRRDFVPPGVTHVMGEINFSEYSRENDQDSTLNQNLKALYSMVLTKSQSLGLEETIAIEVPPLPNMTSAKDDHEQDELDIPEIAKDGPMSKYGVGKLLRQYLARSVPLVAQQSGSIIVCRGRGDIPKHIAQGIGSSLDRCTKSGHTAVFAFSSTAEKKEVECSGYFNSFRAHVFLYSGVSQRTKKLIAATEEEVEEFIQRLLLDLNRGVMPVDEAEMRNTSVTSIGKLLRPRVPVICVLMGGKAHLKASLKRCVAHRWPMVVIEASGGVADDITMTKEEVRKLNPSANIDFYRRSLTTADPAIAEIIVEGNVRVVKRASMAEEVMRLLETNMKGDETLNKAWLLFCQWAHNANKYQYYFKLFQLLILLAGILTTGLSIGQTFLMLQFPTETLGSSGATNRITVTYTVINWTIIALPITISLLNAVRMKANPGGKWASLRTASESLLREIYCYRTNTKGYEPLEMSDVGKPNKQERLQGKMAEITKVLSESEVASITLSEYGGQVPPYFVRSTKDNGYADLTPDEYISMRVDPLIEQYRMDANDLKNQKSLLDFLGYLFGAFGTLLAALAVSKPLLQYNLQAWVAFTTSVANALTRYTDYTRVEWMYLKYSGIPPDLVCLKREWQGKGSDADRAENREHLVGKSEKLISDEVSEWEKQLRSAMEKMEQELEIQETERNKIVRQLQTGEDVDMVQHIKSIGVQELTPEFILSAVSDPHGPESEKLKKILGNVKKELDNVKVFDGLKLIAEKTEIGRKAVELGKEVAETATEVGKQVVAVAKEVEKEYRNVAPIIDALGLTDFIPKEVKGYVDSFCKDGEARKSFLRDVIERKIDPCNISRTDLLRLAENAGQTLKTKVEGLSQRKIIELTKQMGMQQICSEFISGIVQANIDQFSVIPPEMTIEEIIDEFTALMQFGWKELLVAELIELIRNPLLKEKLVTLTEGKLRTVLKRAEKYMLEKRPVTRMFWNVLDIISQIDLDDIMKDTNVRVQIVGRMNEIQGLGQRVCALPQEKLLSFFPEGVRPSLASVSHLQLARHVQRMAVGTASTAMFQTLLVRSPDSLSGDIAVVLRSSEYKERLTSASVSITQTDINRLTKSQILKKIGTSDAATSDIQEALKVVHEGELKDVLSAMKAISANSYAGRVFDELADNLLEFDVRGIFSIPEVELLVREVKCLKPLFISKGGVDSCTKEEILAHFSYTALQEKMLPLAEQHIKQLTSRMISLIDNIFFFKLFLGALKQAIRSTTADTKTATEDIETWDTQLIHRIVFTTAQVSTSVMKLIPASINETRSQEELQKELEQLCVKAKIQPELTYTRTVLKLLNIHLADDEASGLYAQLDSAFGVSLARSIYVYIDEIEVLSLFASASRGLDADTAKKFLKVFSNPFNRKAFVGACMCLISRDECLLQKKDNKDSINAYIMSEKNEVLRKELYTSAARSQCFKEGPKEFYFIIDELCSDADDRAGTLRIILTKLYNEMSMSAGYRIFQQICLSIKSFDLRNLVLDMVVRQNILSVVFTFMEAHDNNFDMITEAEVMDFLDRAERPEEAYLIEVLRVFTERQLVTFFSVAARYLAGAACGKFFVAFERKLNELPTTDRSNAAIERQAIFTLRSQMKIKSEQLTADFDDFDANKFTHKKHDEKKNILVKYIGTGPVATTVASFESWQLERIFNSIRDVNYSSNPYDLVQTIRTEEMSTMNDIVEVAANGFDTYR